MTDRTLVVAPSEYLRLGWRDDRGDEVWWGMTTPERLDTVLAALRRVYGDLPVILQPELPARLSSGYERAP